MKPIDKAKRLCNVVGHKWPRPGRPLRGDQCKRCHKIYISGSW